MVKKTKCWGCLDIAWPLWSSCWVRPQSIWHNISIDAEERAHGWPFPARQQSCLVVWLTLRLQVLAYPYKYISSFEDYQLVEDRPYMGSFREKYYVLKIYILQRDGLCWMMNQFSFDTRHKHGLKWFWVYRSSSLLYHKITNLIQSINAQLCFKANQFPSELPFKSG